MKRKSGFRNVEGPEGPGVEAPVYYYGPYMPNAQPAGTAQISTAPQPTAATPAQKAQNGWLSNENKQALFSTGLGLASQFFQTKMGGGANANQTAPEPQAEKTGPSPILLIGGGLALVTVIGIVIYKMSH